MGLLFRTRLSFTVLSKPNLKDNTKTEIEKRLKATGRFSIFRSHHLLYFPSCFLPVRELGEELRVRVLFFDFHFLSHRRRRSISVPWSTENDVARGEAVGEEGPRHDGRRPPASAAPGRLPGQAARRSPAASSGLGLSLPHVSRRRPLSSYPGSAGPVRISYLCSL